MAAKKDLPSNLAFCRGIEPTEGVMSSVKFNDGVAASFESLLAGSAVKRPLIVDTTTIRGTIANYDDAPAASRVGKGKKSLEAPNISMIERAILPSDASHLLIDCQARFNASGTEPSINNSTVFGAHIASFVQAYAAKGGYQELATRYFLRLACGAWGWRNCVNGGYQTRLELAELNLAMVFKEEDVDLDQGYSMAALSVSKRAEAGVFIDRIAAALAGSAPCATVKASLLIELGAGGEAYPSQEFASESTLAVEGHGDSRPTKILSKLRDSQGRFVATIHARKIGNAIRTIDDWHGKAGVGAIAIEMFGANTQQSQAHRVANDDFYTYFKNVDVLAQEVASGELLGRHHYVAACLIRGGVFGFGGKNGDA